PKVPSSYKRGASDVWFVNQNICRRSCESVGIIEATACKGHIHMFVGTAPKKEKSLEHRKKLRGF
ncbi:hypothetical protein MOC38_11585, partial [Bacillus spizizenii]|nr:hypothetical protein [Bacillus spizizenii]